MIEIFSALGELLYRLFQGLTAWKYVVYKDFRMATHERWRNERRIVVVEEVIGGVMGILITIAICAIIISSVLF